MVVQAVSYVFCIISMLSYVVVMISLTDNIYGSVPGGMCV